MSRPNYLDHSPQPNFIGALLDAPIFFRVYDRDGLDLSTFSVLIEGTQAILNGVFQTGFSGAITKEDHVPQAISVVVIRSTLYGYSQVVNVNSEIFDLLGESGRDSYSFVTVPDPDVKPPIVAASPHGALFNSSLSVTLSCDDPGATIFYTLNGTIPNLSSPVYSVPIPVSAEGKTTLKFLALDQTNNSSGTITEIYVLDTIAPVSIATPAAGSYFDSQQVVLTSNDPQAIIYYTINGSVPSTSSSVYSLPIKLRDNHVTTIKFFAIDKAGNIEGIHSETYSIAIAKNNYKPTNVFVTCPFNQNELYIRWDDMYPVFNKVRGYNIYRADVETGPYLKLNQSVIAITQFSDKTLDTQIINEDVSEQFRRTVNISRDVNDDFSGSGYFNTAKWKEFDPGQLLFQNNGLIFKDSTGLRQMSKLTSVFKLRGNFEIKAGYELIRWISPSTGTQACQFIVKKNDQNFIEISRDKSHLVDLYCSHQYVNGNPELPLTSSTSDVYGEFKITRVGEIVTVFYYDRVSETYVQMASYDNYVEDLYVEFVGKSEDKLVEMKFTNFEMVSGNPIIIEPLSPKQEYKICLSQNHIVDDTGLNKVTDDPKFISVTIDGVEAYVRYLNGIEGIVELETDRMYDEVKKKFFVPPVPNEFSTVVVSYRVPLHSTNIRLRKNYFYKITCVTEEDETDLDLLTPESLKSEKITYQFEEAVRRNAWMLDQAGERVLLYIKKKAGVKCHCTYRDMKERTHKAPDQDCITCFGSGFEGGFDGAFPIIVAPMMTEQRVQQTDRGMKLMYQIETWFGPTPIVSQRDMIIRRNGDRCLIGPITPVEGPGGVTVQQHFVVEVLDGTDIRHKFNVHPLPDKTMQPGVDKSSKHVLNGGPNVATIDSPKEREELYTSEDKISHQNDNVDHVVKGRSITFENTNY